ncbi:hypothetical protein Scep_021224 [Stephania cephalantha]|uniref:Uncharacterized protein n=1 Tax=Stephania cephalantha TaxID=152367 RepID=A0AAP0F314_9MAGN
MGLCISPFYETCSVGSFKLENKCGSKRYIYQITPLFNIHLQQNHQSRFPSPCSSSPSFMPSLFLSPCSPSSRFPSSLSLNLSRLWF